MRAWRLCRRIHTVFDGEGSRLFGGRWSPPGVPVVYTSATASLAALEYFVHLAPAQAPDDLVLIAADLPKGLEATVVELGRLPADRRRYPAPESLAELGAQWVRAAATAILQVPSAVVPQETTYLLNPAHADFARITVGAPETFSFDPRLWKPRTTGRRGRR